MNPTQARKADWNMYYNNTWMEHHKLGPVFVRVDGTSLMIRESAGSREFVSVAPTELTPWWPRSGSCNTKNGAVYITRRAVRNMRKSATSGGGHYIVTYGRYTGDPLCLLAKDPNYLPTKDIPKVILGDSTTYGHAVSRDLILAPSGLEDQIAVYFRGIYSGNLIGKSFDPIAAGHPMSKRAAIKLAQRGII